MAPCLHLPLHCSTTSVRAPNKSMPPPALFLLQNHFRSAVTDEFLRVKGSNGSIFALGDAATIEQNTVRARGPPRGAGPPPSGRRVVFQQAAPPAFCVCRALARAWPSAPAVQPALLGTQLPSLPHARYPSPTPTPAPCPPAQATAKATELFDKYAATHPDGRLTLGELQQLMREASEEFPHLREHATFLDG